MSGRIKRSPLSRTEQLRASQTAYRARMAAGGLVSLQAYGPRRRKMKREQESRGQIKSRAERLTEILETQYAGRGEERR